MNSVFVSHIAQNLLNELPEHLERLFGAGRLPIGEIVAEFNRFFCDSKLYKQFSRIFTTSYTRYLKAKASSDLSQVNIIFDVYKQFVAYFTAKKSSNSFTLLELLIKANSQYLYSFDVSREIAKYVHETVLAQLQYGMGEVDMCPVFFK
jgi:hypothetical protein